MPIHFSSMVPPDGASGPHEPGTPPTVPHPVDGVNSMIVSLTPAVVSASVSAKQNGTVFQASFMPFQLPQFGYLEWLSETKLVVSTDTSTSLTRIALGMGYNPFSARGHRRRGILDDANTKFKCSKYTSIQNGEKYRNLPDAEFSEQVPRARLDEFIGPKR